MNKRAQESIEHENLPFMIIIELIAVLMIISIPFGVANSYGKGAELIKSKAAEDISLLINGWLSVPGVGIIKYSSYNLSALTLSLDPQTNELILSSPSGPDQRRHFSLPQNIFLHLSLVQGPQEICLEKKVVGEKQIILLRECAQNEFPRPN